MGIYSDNFYSFCNRLSGREKAAMDAAEEFDESKHAREGKGSGKGGQFKAKPETIEKQDLLDPRKSVKAIATRKEMEKIRGGGSNSKKVNFTEVKPEEFQKTIEDARNACLASDRWRVDVKTKEDYAKCKNLIVSPGGSCAAVKDDGDIVSVCRNPSDAEVSGSMMLKEAVKQKGDRLDSFDGNWRFYVKNGFEPISWTPFNEDYAPEGWRKGVDREEDIVFFAYTGKTNKGNMIDMKEWKATHKPFEGADGYKKAQQVRDDFINNLNGKTND